MKYLIIILTLLIFSCNKQEEQLNDLYTFTSLEAGNYSSIADTTMFNISENTICVLNEDISYCDVITGKETMNIGVFDILLYSTDVGVTYQVWYNNSELVSINFTSQIGERIRVYNLLSTKKVNWIPVATRSGWSITMN